MPAIAAFFQWFSIFVCHCFFRVALKAQNIHVKSLPFKSPLAPYLQWAGIIIILFILGCEFYLSVSPFGERGSATVSPDEWLHSFEARADIVQTFFANYLGAPLFIFDFVAYKVSRLDSLAVCHRVTNALLDSCGIRPSS